MPTASVEPECRSATFASTASPTDHSPSSRASGSASITTNVGVVVAGDTVPCAGLDELCAGAQALVHTVIRKDIIANIPIQRMQDTLDYHSSPEEAAQTAERAGMTRSCSPTTSRRSRPAAATTGETLAAQHFTGRVELGDDLHHITITQ